MPKRRKQKKLSKSDQLDLDLNRWLGKRDAAIAALVKAMERLKQLERTRKRMNGAIRLAPEPEPSPPIGYTRPLATPTAKAPEKPAPDDLEDIPTFLQIAVAKDEAAKAEIRAHQEAEKKRKADRAKEKRKIDQEVRQAELTGKRRKMPLSGREALKAIHGN